MIAGAISNRKKVALCLAASALSALAAEIAARRLWQPAYPYSRLGWAPKPNHQRTWTVPDSPGKPRKVTNTYHARGFKRWPPGDGKRVLIIGDSVTQMTFVSDGEEWYSYLEQRWPEIDWFVFGAGGYGTLQEYLVLREVADEVKPDVVLWQWCSNDYFNNLWEYDRLAYPYNNHGRRPYLEDGKIVRRLPLPGGWLRDRCRICDRGLFIYDRVRREQANQDVPATIEAFRQWLAEHPEIVQPLRAEAKAVSLRILQRVRETLPAVPVYFLNPCAPISEAERGLCKTVGFIPVEGWSEYVDSKPGRYVVNDRHWNLAGNAAAGEWIVRHFEAEGIFGP